MTLSDRKEAETGVSAKIGDEAVAGANLQSTNYSNGLVNSVKSLPGHVPNDGFTVDDQKDMYVLFSSSACLLARCEQL